MKWIRNSLQQTFPNKKELRIKQSAHRLLRIHRHPVTKMFSSPAFSYVCSCGDKGPLSLRAVTVWGDWMFHRDNHVLIIRARENYREQMAKGVKSIT